MAHEDREGMSEMACTYASLILADDDIPITADKIATLLKAAGINFVEPFWPNMFARALENQDIRQLLFNGGVGAGGPAAASDDAGPAAGAGAPAAAAAAAAPEKKEEKKPEPESESDDDMGLDLFG